MGLTDRGARNDPRQRRALQKLGFDPAAALGFTGGDGINISPSGEFSVDILTNGGLEFSGGELTVNVDENFGLSLNASGIRIDVLTAGGLTFSGGDLSIKIDPAANNLSTVSSAGLNTQGPLTTKGDIWVWSTTNARFPVGTNGQILSAASGQATGLQWIAAPTGTVTSVGLTMPTGFAVANSPITTSGTLAVTLSGMTSGSVFFTNGTDLLQNNTNFFWDNTTNLQYLRLGSGTAGGEIRLLEGSAGGTNYVGFKANVTLAGNTLYTLPTAFPASTQFLRSSSVGVMSFSAVVTATAGSTAGDMQYRATSTTLGATAGFNFDSTEGTLTIPSVLDTNNILILTASDTTPVFTVGPGGIVNCNEIHMSVSNGMFGTFASAVECGLLAVSGSTAYIGPFNDDAGATTGCPVELRYGRGNSGGGEVISISGASRTISMPLDLKLTTAGNGHYVKEGTNATMGRSTLVGGTVVVNTTKVTANSEIFLTTQTPGGTLGAVYVSARTAGTSFTITSLNVLDTSAVAWLIMEPA